MTRTAEQLLMQAMNLAPADRAEIAERLDESVPDGGDAEYRAEWESEIRDRVSSVLSGAEKPIPWRDAMEQIRRDCGSTWSKISRSR
jgi:putative addiction module component (TIGR02574 family)